MRMLVLVLVLVGCRSEPSTAPKPARPSSNFEVALKRDRIDEVKQLVKAGRVALNAPPWPLHLAARHMGYRSSGSALVDLLVEAGADPNQVDTTGATPLMAALDQGAAPIAAALVAKGARLDVSWRGHGPLQLAANRLVCRQALYGCETGAANSCEVTARDMLAPAGRLVEHLVLHLAPTAAQLDRVGPSEQTPLHWAVIHAQDRLVELLLAKGADPRARTPASTPASEVAPAGHSNALHLAARFGTASIIRRLLAASRDLLRTTDGRRRTASEIALASGRADLWSVLFVAEGGCDGSRTSVIEISPSHGVHPSGGLLAPCGELSVLLGQEQHEVTDHFQAALPFLDKQLRFWVAHPHLGLLRDALDARAGLYPTRIFAGLRGGRVIALTTPADFRQLEMRLRRPEDALGLVRVYGNVTSATGHERLTYSTFHETGLREFDLGNIKRKTDRREYWHDKQRESDHEPDLAGHPAVRAAALSTPQVTRLPGGAFRVVRFVDQVFQRRPVSSGVVRLSQAGKVTEVVDQDGSYRQSVRWSPTPNIFAEDTVSGRFICVGCRCLLRDRTFEGSCNRAIACTLPRLLRGNDEEVRRLTERAEALLRDPTKAGQTIALADKAITRTRNPRLLERARSVLARGHCSGGREESARDLIACLGVASKATVLAHCKELGIDLD